jgi:predicted anti-sigma-YlaC factor YlaD
VSSHGSCGEARLALAVYMLGAIEPADRDVVDRHLPDCVSCRDELAGLAALPALLRRISPQEAVALLDDDTTATA